jgi:hypothetical protein
MYSIDVDFKQENSTGNRILVATYIESSSFSSAHVLMPLSVSSDENVPNVPSGSLLSLDSFHQKGEAASMYH